LNNEILQILINHFNKRKNYVLSQEELKWLIEKQTTNETILDWMKQKYINDIDNETSNKIKQLANEDISALFNSPPIINFLESLLKDNIDALKAKYMPQNLTIEQLNYIQKQIYRYIINNLESIASQLNIKKDNGLYHLDWAGSNLDLNRLYDIYEKLKSYVFDHLPQILDSINLDNITLLDILEEKDKLSEIFADNNLNIIRKIRNILIQKNQSVKNTLSVDFVNQNDDDKIDKPNAVTINFNVLNDYVRDRPIIIIKGDNTGKDYILFGHVGDSHGRAYNTVGKIFIKQHNITPRQHCIGYGYLVKDIAFIDNNNLGYSIDEMVSLLKNHLKIRKVYTSPEHHVAPGKSAIITRLAKKITANNDMLTDFLQLIKKNVNYNSFKSYLKLMAQNDNSPTQDIFKDILKMNGQLMLDYVMPDSLESFSNKWKLTNINKFINSNCETINNTILSIFNSLNTNGLPFKINFTNEMETELQQLLTFNRTMFESLINKYHITNRQQMLYMIEKNFIKLKFTHTSFT